MVWKEETKSSWVWPLSRDASTKICKEDTQDAECESDCQRGFEIADTLELGLAREIVTDFMHLLRRSSKLWRFRVSRSDDGLQYRLFSDEGNFLMYARLSIASHKVLFFLYSPIEKKSSLFDQAKPVFSMTLNEAKTEWRLVQERCENCRFSPQHLVCGAKQQVAFFRHFREPIGDGIFNGMEANIPGLYSDESRVVWCEKLGRGNLGLEPFDDSFESQKLVSNMPSWNDEVGSLVLDFQPRNVLSSTKNFQLSCKHRPKHVICQYGKIGANTFGLDLRYPLSVVQAFGAAVTTSFWK